jgi:DNA-binding NarL/FixJ family response regulator
VARLAKVSKTSKRIAAQLYLSVSSVETHLAHVYQRHTQICRFQKATVRSAARSRCGRPPGTLATSASEG